MTRIVRAAGPLLLAVLLAISGLTTFTYSQAPQTPTPSTAPPVTPAAIVGNVIGGSWNPAGTLLAAWRTDGSLTIEDRGGVVRVHLDHENPIRSFSWSSADANVFVYIPIYGSAHVVKVTELGYEVIGQYSMAGGRLREAQIDAVGVRLAVINSAEYEYPKESRLEVVDVASGQLVFDYGSDYMSFIDIAWDPTGQSRLILSEVDELATTLRMFDVTSQTEIWSHEIPEGGPATVVWSPDGTTFVSVSTAAPHAVVALHNASSGVILRILESNLDSMLYEPYWAPNPNLILSGSNVTLNDVVYEVWDQDVQQIVDVVPQSSCSISSWPCTMPTATATPAAGDGG
ncbi:MAG: WD40 repeat domain-containing protein [Chloroflexi bacterium]|nr:WD40 repeat domain-containing protein [Chloroflexota bacterium]